MTAADERLNNQPKFKIGQCVQVFIETKDDKSGLTFKNEVFGLIMIIRATGTSEKTTYDYGITTDLPACYYNGKPPFTYILEDNIVLLEDALKSNK